VPITYKLVQAVRCEERGKKREGPYGFTKKIEIDAPMQSYMCLEVANASMDGKYPFDVGDKVSFCPPFPAPPALSSGLARSVNRVRR